MQINFGILGYIILFILLTIVSILALVYFFSITYAHNCVDFTPENYTFVSNNLGICEYETLGDLDYKRCTLNLIDTTNHGTIVGSSTCNKTGVFYD